MIKSEINKIQTWRKVLAFFLLILLFGAANVCAQFPPKELKNLKVFPKEIAINELIENMKGFTGRLVFVASIALWVKKDASFAMRFSCR